MISSIIKPAERVLGSDLISEQDKNCKHLHFKENSNLVSEMVDSDIIIDVKDNNLFSSRRVSHNVRKRILSHKLHMNRSE